MKTLAIILATFVLGCGDAPSQQKEITTTGSGGINLPDNGSEYTSPCDLPSYSTFVVGGKTVVVETPTLCNQGFAPDRGDPCPDCEGDPSPWDKYMNPQSHTENIRIQVQRQQQQQQQQQSTR